MAMTPQARTENLARRMCRSRHVHGAIFAVGSNGGETHVAGAGDLDPHRRFHAASVTKLVVTIAVMQQVEAGRLALDDSLARHLPADLIAGLHVKDGVDRSGAITIRHLLSNQTGLPDYFSLKSPGAPASMDALLAGEDSEWPLERVVALVRGKPPLFLPGQTGKLDYSDTNYQLLGRVLETLSGKPVARLFADDVFTPLGLRDTYVYTDIEDTTPAPFWADQRQIRLPRYIASVGAEGGMISTGADLVTLGKAFFSGRFFDIDAFLSIQDWRLLLWPGQFYFGTGLEKLWTPWFLSPLNPIRNVMGFWGQTGAFLFHHPDTGLYFAGTANQTNGHGHATAVHAILKSIKSTRP